MYPSLSSNNHTKAGDICSKCVFWLTVPMGSFTLLIPFHVGVNTDTKAPSTRLHPTSADIHCHLRPSLNQLLGLVAVPEGHLPRHLERRRLVHDRLEPARHTGQPLPLAGLQAAGEGRRQSGAERHVSQRHPLAHQVGAVPQQRVQPLQPRQHRLPAGAAWSTRPDAAAAEPVLGEAAETGAPAG